ncbi:MAG TPA: AtpZ/AtpI family protein [Anaeromyxobacteraceae bacterium]|nr:AtpZ/AtpI family protein [Anaeromyxobacteraceae bacterium]
MRSHETRIDERCEESERGLSNEAAAYRRAEPYMAASSTLMGSVAVFTALGYGLDRWLGQSVHWLLVTGAVFGIAIGFIGFFTRVLRADAEEKRLRSGNRPGHDATAAVPAVAPRGPPCA